MNVVIPKIIGSRAKDKTYGRENYQLDNKFDNEFQGVLQAKKVRDSKISQQQNTFEDNAIDMGPGLLTSNRYGPTGGDDVRTALSKYSRVIRGRDTNAFNIRDVEDTTLTEAELKQSATQRALNQPRYVRGGVGSAADPYARNIITGVGSSYNNAIVLD